MKMNKYPFFLGLFFMLLVGCKNQEPQKDAENPSTEISPENREADRTVDADTVLIGDFLEQNNVAIIQGKDFIYGVKLDSLGRLLTEKVKPAQQDEYDMVPVVIKGIIKKNPSTEGWDQIVEITKIINISKSKSQNEAIEINSNN